MNAWWLALGSIITLVSGYFLKIWVWIVADIRLDNNLSCKIYKELKSQKYKKIQFEDYMGIDEDDDDLPPSLTYYVWHKIPFRFKVVEQEMKAGYQGTRKIATITTLRPFKKYVQQFIRQHAKIIKDYYSCVYIDGYYRCAYKIPEQYQIPSLAIAEKNKLEQLVHDLKNKKQKKGLLLYGPPGNGKTSIVKWLAAQLQCYIYIPLIQQDTTDAQLISMFTSLPRELQSIILMEDFDNHFNGRKCIHEDAKLNFSTVLNVLDGLYCDLSDKLIVMTTNKLENVDPAIRCRPSRFDICMCINHPDYQARYEILAKENQPNDKINFLANITDGQSGAIVAEIAKHKFTSNIDLEVKSIIDSFDPKELQYNTHIVRKPSIKKSTLK